MNILADTVKTHTSKGWGRGFFFGFFLVFFLLTKKAPNQNIGHTHGLINNNTVQCTVYSVSTHSCQISCLYIYYLHFQD
jgi:hypothetical protein